MMITYGIICETFIHGSILRSSYGIAAYAHADNTDTDTVIAVINDISGDYDSIFNLVKSCNEGELLPEHLNDVVEDFLTSK